MTLRGGGRPLLLAFLVGLSCICLAVSSPVVSGLINDTVARGRSGAVVSAQSLASQVGLRILRQGGNAVDAAVAVALALAVCHPEAGNLGGGGFMVISMANGSTATLDFRETAPAAAHRDMYLQEDGSVHPEKSLYGMLAAGVPGSPAGLAAAHARFGSMQWKKLVTPAIALARKGIAVDHFLAKGLAKKAEILGRFASTRQVFFKEEKPLQQGDRLLQEDLARTLQRLADKGVAGFYRGETADCLVKAMAQAEGLITHKDLQDYKPLWREPLVGSYRDYEVLCMSPVSSGGIALLQMLNILEGYDLGKLGYGSSQGIHRLVQAMQRAYADRARWLGDPAFVQVPVQGLADKKYAAKLRESMDAKALVPVQHGVPAGAPESKDTTHFSVVDAAGNAVSCTTTINSSFGNGVVVEGAGFLLNNEMDDFSAKPGVPNQFGLLGGLANAIQPGKRMLSSMTPTIIRKDGKVCLVLGSPGGGRIINTVLQVAINVLDHQMPLDEAVRAPRVHHQWKPKPLFWERNSLSADVRAKLAGMGHEFHAEPISIGRCQAIQILQDGLRVGAADPRTSGSAAAY